MVDARRHEYEFEVSLQDKGKKKEEKKREGGKGGGGVRSSMLAVK